MLEDVEASLSPRTDLKAGDAINQRTRRKRLQLNCGECRNKKLSCDRKLPCQRCVRSGRPALCSFGAVIGQQHSQAQRVTETDSLRESAVVRDLHAEVARLKELLSNASRGQHERNYSREILPFTSSTGLVEAIIPVNRIEVDQSGVDIPKVDQELPDPRERSSTYYSQHTLLKFFQEIPQLFPFIKETSNEWLKPLGLHLGKNRSAKHEWWPISCSQTQHPIEHLLPPKADTDTLISFYLSNMEQLHRIVHIPTFKREYENFWAPGQARQPAMTALVLAMISVSAITCVNSTDSVLQPPYRTMPIQWVTACDDWLRRQSSKHRKLVHYQISCLSYLAKRINIFKKKYYWKETGSLIQDAVMDGLHCEPSPVANSPYMCEMKRRIWTTIRELDLQNSIEFGLPTLLYSIECTIGTPANLDDEDFDQASKTLPTPKDSELYTCASYQFHSSRSWPLRLEISRRLFSPGTSTALIYGDVLQITHEVTQVMAALPHWATPSSRDTKNNPLLASAFLQFQLIECILAIHRPYLQKESGKFWLSENTSYQMARNVVLLSIQLGGSGSHSLAFLREDLLLGSLTLARMTLLQLENSTGTIMTNAKSTMELLEQCLPLIHNRYLRCSHEPWCFVTICSALMLLKIHFGEETWQTAKSSCARRFIALHFRQFGGQQSTDMDAANDVDDPNTFQLPISTASDPIDSEWPDSSYADICIDPFDLDMDANGMWQTWEGERPKLPAHSH